MSFVILDATTQLMFIYTMYNVFDFYCCAIHISKRANFGCNLQAGEPDHHSNMSKSCFSSTRQCNLSALTISFLRHGVGAVGRRNRRRARALNDLADRLRRSLIPLLSRPYFHQEAPRGMLRIRARAPEDANHMHRTPRTAKR